MECVAVSAVIAIERCKPDVILASLSMSGTCAMEMIARFRSLAPSARIVGLISQCSEYLVHSLAKSEYHGLYCDADEGLAGLIQAIENVMQGRRVVSASIVKYQLGLRSAPAAFPKLLSKRELQALVCIAHAMTDEEIGQRMAISAGTAQAHRKKIMYKLSIHSTPKLMGYCMEKGFHTAVLPLPTLRNIGNADTVATWKGRPIGTAC